MLIYVVPGPVPEDIEVNLQSFNESFENLELLINTPVSYYHVFHLLNVVIYCILVAHS